MPDDFWKYAPREISLIVDAASRRDARAAWLAAKYMAVSYHHPKDMPDDPGKPPEVRGGLADRDYVRAYFKSLAKGPQNGN